MQHGPARQQAAGALGEEAHDLVPVALPLLEHAFDHAGLEHLLVDRLEVLLRGDVDDDRRAVGRQALVQVLGDARAPEGVQVLAVAVGQRGAHFEPVGLQAVQRAQQAVQAAEDAHMVLGPGELGGREAAGVEAAVDVAVEGEGGLAGVLVGALGRPGGVAGHVEGRELVRQVHQLGDVLGRLLAQQLDEFDRGAARGFEMGLGGGSFGGDGGVVVERLRGGKQEQHQSIMWGWGFPGPPR
ncbi:hypothetical protein D3C71_1409060 [compost metagenome]